MNAKVAIAGAVMALGATFVAPAVSDAQPLCERRSEAHAAQHGGTRIDSDWHIAHGELPTCEREDQGTDHRDDEPDYDDRWGRDHFGIHCTWRGCG